MIFQNQFKIDGQDVFDTYGIIFEKGIYDELLKLPTRKEIYAQSWKDQHGTQRYVDENFYESRELTANMVILANDKADYLQKLTIFSTKMLSGYFQLDAIELNLRFTLLYKSMQQLSLLTRLKNGRVASRFQINFIDDFPLNHPNIQ